VHIYAFGSVCRGDISRGSDVDLLALVASGDDRFDPETYSIYSYERLCQLWREGNPFAWHLQREARLLHADDGIDFLSTLGLPAPYENCAKDCERFLRLFETAQGYLETGGGGSIFELSIVFLSLRNFATCYSLGALATPDFSRRSELRIGTDSLIIGDACYRVLENARLLCTRGYGAPPDPDVVVEVIGELGTIRDWMYRLVQKANLL
jgi:hypothetical protein